MAARARLAHSADTTCLTVTRQRQSKTNQARPDSNAQIATTERCVTAGYSRCPSGEAAGLWTNRRSGCRADRPFPRLCPLDPAFRTRACLLRRKSPDELRVLPHAHLLPTFRADRLALACRHASRPISERLRRALRLADGLRHADHPAADAIHVAAIPHERQQAREFLLGLPERLEGRSLLVHVGAWREVHEGQPVNIPRTRWTSP